MRFPFLSCDVLYYSILTIILTVIIKYVIIYVAIQFESILINQDFYLLSFCGGNFLVSRVNEIDTIKINGYDCSILNL